MPALSPDDGKRQAEAGRGHRRRTRVGWVRLGHRLHHLGSISTSLDQLTTPSRHTIRHARRGAGTGQGNPRPRALEPDFRVKTEAGPRRIMVLRVTNPRITA